MILPDPKPLVAKIYKPHKGPQTAFITCPIQEILFGGARGGGKSFAVALKWAAYAQIWGEAAVGLLIRKSYQDLEDFNEKKLKAILTPLGWHYQVGKHTWVHPNGATLRLGYIDNKGDEEKYLGQEYSVLILEELTTWPNSDQLDKLRGSLRSAAGAPCCIWATTNPGGVGHEWVKKRYITPAPPRIPFYSKQLETWIVYIPALLIHNPSLAENDPFYIKRLKGTGKKHLVRAWIRGDWDISEEGNVYKRDWFQYYKWNPYDAVVHRAEGLKLGYPELLQIVQSWDPGQKTGEKNDYTVGTTWGIGHAGYYLLDMVRGKMAFPTLMKLVPKYAYKWFADIIYMEDKSSGSSIIQMAKEHTRLPIVGINPDQNKFARASAVSHLYETGRVLIPDPECLPWVEDYIEELCSYTAESTKDDIVDCQSQALQQMIRFNHLQEELAENYEGVEELLGMWGR